MARTKKPVLRKKSRATRAKAKKAGFRSGFEHKIAQQLSEECVEWQYEAQKFTYIVPEKGHKYTADFVIQTRTGTMYIETKGLFSAADRKKYKLVRDQHNIDLRLLFEVASRQIGKRKNSRTYGQWATENGFKWAERTIPKEWLKEMITK